MDPALVVDAPMSGTRTILPGGQPSGRLESGESGCVVVRSYDGPIFQRGSDIPSHASDSSFSLSNPVSPFRRVIIHQTQKEATGSRRGSRTPTPQGRPILRRGCLPFHHPGICAQEGSRTPTPLKAPDFESGASAIPPLEQVAVGSGGIGPPTPPVSRECSTSELRACVVVGHRGVEPLRRLVIGQVPAYRPA